MHLKKFINIKRAGTYKEDIEYKRVENEVDKTVCEKRVIAGK